MTAHPHRKQLDQTWKYRIKRWRRGLRARLSLWAARRFGTPVAHAAELSAIPQSILVVRINKRLGNILFLTPLLSTLAATFPKARIDVLLREAAHADLLVNLPGVTKVWALPSKPARHPLRFFQWMRLLRACQYDLVIDPNIISVSNRIGTLLCGARERLGFAGEDQWLRLDYSAPTPQDEPHQALQALRLLQNGIHNLHPQIIEEYRVAPGEPARIAAQAHWQRAFAAYPPTPPVVGFFAQATGAKNLGQEWWQVWVREMQRGKNAPTLLQLLPPGDTPALQPGLAGIRVTPLDELAATLSYLNLFVAADCGPMHLAAAAGVPTVGLFTATHPDAYRPLGRNCITLTGDVLDPAEAAAKTLAQLRAINSS